MSHQTASLGMLLLIGDGENLWNPSKLVCVEFGLNKFRSRPIDGHNGFRVTRGNLVWTDLDGGSVLHMKVMNGLRTNALHRLVCDPPFRVGSIPWSWNFPERREYPWMKGPVDEIYNERC